MLDHRLLQALAEFCAQPDESGEAKPREFIQFSECPIVPGNVVGVAINAYSLALLSFPGEGWDAREPNYLHVQSAQRFCLLGGPIVGKGGMFRQGHNHGALVFGPISADMPEIGGNFPNWRDALKLWATPFAGDPGQFWLTGELEAFTGAISAIFSDPNPDGAEIVQWHGTGKVGQAALCRRIKAGRVYGLAVCAPVWRIGNAPCSILAGVAK